MFCRSRFLPGISRLMLVSWAVCPVPLVLEQAVFRPLCAAATANTLLGLLLPPLLTDMYGAVSPLACCLSIAKHDGDEPAQEAQLAALERYSTDVFWFFVMSRCFNVLALKKYAPPLPPPLGSWAPGGPLPTVSCADTPFCRRCCLFLVMSSVGSQLYRVGWEYWEVHQLLGWRLVRSGFYSVRPVAEKLSSTRQSKAAGIGLAQLE